MNNVPHLVLTGGPCAGKTTALNYVCEKLLDRGFYPIIVPEIPTLLITSGITPKNGMMSITAFEGLIIEHMLFTEQLTDKALKELAHEQPVVIHDRGLMDIKAYTDDQTFAYLMDRYGLSIVHMRDKRYDAVFHLRTAALGAEAFYTNENNAARMETLEEARTADERTLASWNGHPHLVVIDNSTDFEGKLHRLFRSICKSLAIPAPLEIECKFMLAPVEWDVFHELGIPVVEIDIEQFYIVPPPGGNHDVEIRLRKRTQYGESMYWKTYKRKLSPMVRIETEEQISEAEYAWSKVYQEPGTAVIRKKRHCFVSENQYFELDVFSEGSHAGLYLLEVELTDEAERVMLPGFLDVMCEVTDDPLFSNYQLART